MNEKSIDEQIIEFIEERDWKKFHSPRNLVIAIGAEVGELMECFQWKSDQDIEVLVDKNDIEEVKDEIADVYTYLVSLCHSLNIDLEESVRNKLEKNKEKYPISKSFGNAKKYTKF